MIATIIVLLIILISIICIIGGLAIGEETITVIGIFLLICSVLIGPIIIDGIDYAPYRAENAQQVCISRGFDNYLSYSGIFKTRAYGVTCKYVTESRVNVNSQESIPIVIKTQ